MFRLRCFDFVVYILMFRILETWEQVSEVGGLAPGGEGVCVH